MLVLVAVVLSFLSMADWHVDESFYDLDLELSESDISLCSDEISNYSPSCSEDDSDIESDQNAAVTSSHTFFVAESSTNFTAVSQSGDDISKYQSPNSENGGSEDHNDIDDI